MTYDKFLEINVTKEEGWCQYSFGQKYVGLANIFFRLNKLNDSKLKNIVIPKDKEGCDEKFYLYLRELFENDRIKESFVLSKLKEYYTTNEKLSHFVFNPYKDDNELLISQKWHFFISLYLLREYWGKINPNGKQYSWKDRDGKCHYNYSWIITEKDWQEENDVYKYIECPELRKWIDPERRW